MWTVVLKNGNLGLGKCDEVLGIGNWALEARVYWPGRIPQWVPVHMLKFRVPCGRRVI